MKIGAAAFAIGGLMTLGLVGWFGARSIGADVVRAAWALPPIVALHVVQLWASAIAWRSLAAAAAAPSVGLYLLVRWIRESVNSLLPVAQIGGNLVGVRLLAQRGVALPVAAAATTLDLTIEALTQFVLIAAGVACLAATSRDRSWAPWVGAGLLATGLGLAGFVAAQRAGLMRLVEALAQRLARMFPALPADALAGLHDASRRLQANRPALLRAAMLHLATWFAGTGETWLALLAMGQGSSFSHALVIECFGQAARSAGFAVPGALGVQEAGLALTAGLFAIPVDIALALSMVKRLRELLVGLPGLAAWQWLEGRRLIAARDA